MPQDNCRVCEFIKGCSVCQRNKTEHLHPAGLLQSLAAVWQDIAMDFVEGFLKVGGKSVVLTIVDRLSMYGHFITLGYPYTTMSVAKAFFEHVIWLHGIPASIVSDRDPIFTSAICGTQLRLSSAFCPQTDGQSEVMNRIITVYLCCLAGDRLKSWLQ
jgi:hypothetical protein